MKITSIKAIPWAPDLRPDVYGVLHARNFVAVKVETDEGITGWGDATIGPLAVAKLVEEFGAIIIGEDIEDNNDFTPKFSTVYEAIIVPNILA